MKIADWIVEDGEGDDTALVTCANGCPEGGLGIHKFSCFWAGGTWEYCGTPALIRGDSDDEACLELEDGTHLHVSLLGPASRESLVRKP